MYKQISFCKKVQNKQAFQQKFRYTSKTGNVSKTRSADMSWARADQHNPMILPIPNTHTAHLPHAPPAHKLP